MKNVCLRWFSALILALVAVVPVAAQGKKPVLVVATSAIEEMTADIGYITEAVGYAQFGQMAGMFVKQYTEGLDTSRPVGFILRTDGEAFHPLGILPVKSLASFLASLEEQLGETEDVGDGILELSGPAPVYLKEQGDWAFVSDSIDHLAVATLPKDPIKLLDGLNRSYDIAVKVFVQNVPQQYKEMALEQIREGVEMSAQSLPEGDEAKMQRDMLENSIKQWESILKGVDQLTMGFKIDASGRLIQADSVMTAVEGTKIGRQMAAYKDAKTRFGGFLNKSAAVTFNMSSDILEEDVQATSDLIKNAKTMANKAIDESDDFKDEEMRKTVKSLLETLLEVTADTVEGGKVDVAGSLTVADDALTWISGMQVINATKLESVVKQLAEEVESKPNAPKFELGYGEHSGVTLHRITLQVPEDKEDAREILGESLEVILGVADESIYVAVGDNAEGAMKAALDNSGETKATLPYNLKVELTPLAKYFQQFDEESEPMAAFVAALENADDDRIVAKSKPIENGMASRFEIAEGVLRAIGEAVRAAQGEFAIE